MIVDFRLRPPYGAFRQASMFADLERTPSFARAARMEPPPSLLSGSLDQMFSEMSEAGIDFGVVPCRRGSGVLGDVSNQEVAVFVREHPKKFIGFAAPDTVDFQKAAEEVPQLMSQPEFRGIVLEPGIWRSPVYANDRKLFTIYDSCQQLGVPLMLMVGGNSGPDLTYISPLLVDQVAAAFPRMTLIVAHGGWPFVQEIIHVAFRRTNVYLAPDWYVFMPGWRDYVDAANSFLQDRFLFATAYPFVPLGTSVERFKALMDPEVLPKLFAENALRVLKLDPKEVGESGSSD